MYGGIHYTPLLPRQRYQVFSIVCVRFYRSSCHVHMYEYDIQFALNRLHTQNKHRLRYWTTRHGMARHTNAFVFGYQTRVCACVSMQNDSQKETKNTIHRVFLHPSTHKHTHLVAYSVCQPVVVVIVCLCALCRELIIYNSLFSVFCFLLRFCFSLSHLASSLWFQLNYTLVIIELVVVQHAMSTHGSPIATQPIETVWGRESKWVWIT